jgi:uncharacterized protein (DUF2147 family)
MIPLKKLILRIALITIILSGITGMASAQADPIEGIWFNDKKDAKIQVFKANGKFYGKIIWIKEQTKLDENNPKPALRSKSLVGLVILLGCEKDGDTYDNGRIYDPENGKTYSCTIKNKGNNTLALRGYIGLSLFGRTTEWERTN